MDEWEWLDRLAEVLGEPPVDREQTGAMLKLSRDVAHGVERKLAPLSTFVAGMHVARRVGEGGDPQAALAEVLDAVGRMLPPQDERA